jgi:hypothetical protein
VEEDYGIGETGNIFAVGVIKNTMYDIKLREIWNDPQKLISLQIGILVVFGLLLLILNLWLKL